jgi:hypothetical protein
MSIFQRLVLLIKVLVMLSLGMSAAWANTAVQGHDSGFVAAKTVQGSMQLAKSESEGGDEGQGGSKDDDDGTTGGPDNNDDPDDGGDSDT